MKRLTPVDAAYVVLGILCFARAYTWLATNLGDTAHVGFLEYVPNPVTATIWIIAGIATLFGRQYFLPRYVGIVLGAGMNAAVGAASLFNRTLGEPDGITLSIAISYLTIAVMTIFLPRLTDAHTVLNGGENRGE